MTDNACARRARTSGQMTKAITSEFRYTRVCQNQALQVQARLFYLRTPDRNLRPQQDINARPPRTTSVDCGSGTAAKVTLSIAKFQKSAFVDVMDTVVIPSPGRDTVLAEFEMLPDSTSITVAVSPRSSDTVYV